MKAFEIGWLYVCADVTFGIFSSPEPKARVSYCHSAPCVVRPSSSSVRKLFTFSTSSKPLDGFWWNLVGMKYSWSLTSVVVFRPDPPRGRAKIGHGGGGGVPFFKKLLLQTGRLQRQTEWIAMIYKHVGRSVVTFGSIPKSNFRRVFDVFLYFVILPYFNAISMDFYAVKCLIYIYFV